MTVSARAILADLQLAPWNHEDWKEVSHTASVMDDSSGGSRILNGGGGGGITLSKTCSTALVRAHEAIEACAQNGVPRNPPGSARI